MSTYRQIFYQIVFSTKNRDQPLSKQMKLNYINIFQA
jgi:hypothetical protein